MEPQLLFEELLPGGGAWSWIVRRHCSLRITDLHGAANVALLAYNVEQPLERLNLPDTLKAQYTAKLTRGHVLMSDMGRVLFSIAEDTAGWHDPLGGHGNPALARLKYGERTYQEARNEWTRNTHDNFLVELGKHGLGRRDLAANVNLFSRLDVDAEGRLRFHQRPPEPGRSVVLRAEMNVLVVLDTCQHPLDPNPAYAPQPVSLALYQTAPPAPDDECRLHRPENGRAFTLTERLFAGA